VKASVLHAPNLRGTNLPGSERPEPFRGSNPGKSTLLDHTQWKKEIDIAVVSATEMGISLKILRNLERSLFKEQLELFINSLLLWDRIPCMKSQTKEEVYFRCLTEGPSYAKSLKDLRFYSMQNKISMIDVDHDEEIREFYGYDCFYNHNNLIHWKEEVNDFQWSFLESSYDEGFYEEIEVELNALLDKLEPDSLAIDPLKVIFGIKNSGGYLPGYEGKINSYLELSTLDSRTRHVEKDKMLVGRRCIIQAFPAGTRDSSVPTPESLYKIKHDSLLLKKLVNIADGSAMTDINLSKTLNRCKIDAPHLLIDIKKCGLAFPRRFFRLLAKVFDERGIHHYFSEYERTYIVDGKKSYRTSSGFFLGWSNEAPTLIQCLILKIVQRQFKNITAVIYNDDSDWVLRGKMNDAELLTARALIRACYLSSGLLLSNKKEILSYASVFCEIYNRFEENMFGDSRKRQVATRLLARAKSCKYKTLKLLYTQQAVRHYEDDLADLFDDVLYDGVKYGALHKESYVVPVAFGGVNFKKCNGLDYCYEQYYDLSNRAQILCYYFRRLSPKMSRGKLYVLAASEVPAKAKTVNEIEKIEVNARIVLNEEIIEEKNLIETDNWLLTEGFAKIAKTLANTDEIELLIVRRARNLVNLIDKINDLAEERDFRKVFDPG
jgi:hypothetical protein